MLDYAKVGLYSLIYNLSRKVDYPLAMPINITLSITGVCYSKCKTCNIWKIHRNNPSLSKKELSGKEWDIVLKKIGKTPVWFTITGGETLLRKDLPHIIDLIAKHNKPKYINIATSAIYPKKIKTQIGKILKTTSKNNIQLTVNVSVDEINEKYDFVRGVPKGFEKVKESVALLKEFKSKYSNLVLGTNFVLSKYNYKRFYKIFNHIQAELEPDSFVSEIGAKRNAIYFDDDVSIPMGKYKKIFKKLIDNETQKTKNSRIIAYFRKKYYKLVLDHLRINEEVLKCYAGYASCEISPRGDVWNCAVRTDTMGNLRDHNYDLSKVWRTKTAKKVRRMIKEEKCFCNTANPNYTNMLCNFKF